MDQNLVSAIYRTVERLGADYQVLSVFGSIGDTLSESEVTALLEDWLSTGEIMHSAQ